VGSAHTTRLDVREAGGVEDRCGLRADRSEGAQKEKSGFDGLDHGYLNTCCRVGTTRSESVLRVGIAILAIRRELLPPKSGWSTFDFST
jgi:hypothetical protein